MPRRTVAKLATVSAVVAVSVLAVAPSAHADLVTYCIGTGGAVTVPNDLYVPAGESCALTGTTITGNVSVAAGGNLVVSGGRVSGEVRVAADGYLDATDTTIGGQVVLAAGGYGAFLKDATAGTVTVRPKGSATVDSFLFVEGSTIAGHVNVQAGEVRLDRGTQVERNVSSTGTYYTDVHDSFVDGTLSVLNSTTGSVVCGSAVRGQATFSGNLGGVQVGPNGVLDGCASGGYWGRDVSITNTTGGVTVDDNIIDGRLTVTSNNPVAQVAANNRIRGGVTGEQAGANARSARIAAAPDREDAGEQRAQARRTSAVQEAAAAGDAGL
ncbi:hypothetical protein [Micromonospora sp. WMMD812]|uniref:hypothetical protein n=1 Tax=Micromonospora sp. WMMD812 TaxID=3015152 RepID=UPI00248C31C0|nr:hypothetical protein [Micromonospora sp. WMMD812]WBB67855.1 hypothetical protein O7603_00300 [Micromonospora sp. WMMD812]